MYRTYRSVQFGILPGRYISVGDKVVLDKLGTCVKVSSNGCGWQRIGDFFKKQRRLDVELSLNKADGENMKQ